MCSSGSMSIVACTYTTKHLKGEIVNLTHSLHNLQCIWFWYICLNCVDQFKECFGFLHFICPLHYITLSPIINLHIWDFLKLCLCSSLYASNQECVISTADFLFSLNYAKISFKMISMSCVVSNLFFPHLVMCLTCTRYTRLKYFNLPYTLPLTTCHSSHQRVDIVLSKDKICMHCCWSHPHTYFCDCV